MRNLPWVDCEGDERGVAHAESPVRCVSQVTIVSSSATI
jgi:hypothetical protein